VELFDWVPPLNLVDFWEMLLCRGGSLVHRVDVGISKKHAYYIPLPAYRWYPRSLVKTLLLVSGAFLARYKLCKSKIGKKWELCRKFASKIWKTVKI